MKKTVVIITLLLSCVGFTQNLAKIEFKHKHNTIDYGKISKNNDSGIRAFQFTNTGNAPLILYSVQATTNCTILYVPEKPIQPGKSDKIEIKYAMVTGPIRKTITVESNATNYPEGRIPLRIIGEVVRHVQK